MIKKITEFLNLLISIVKARWILVLIFTAVLTTIIWLRERILSPVEIHLPLIVIILILAFASYPFLKLFEWIVTKSPSEPVLFQGLLWKPSRLRFRFPKPVCPTCKCNILYREEMKQIHVVQSIKDLRAVNDDRVTYIYECPNHGKLRVPNEQMEYLQRLAKAKIDGEN